jgi:hypothetical protein
MFLVAQAAQSDGLSLSEVLANIPHDGPAIIVYAMLLVFAGFIWYGSRKKST